MYSLQVFPGVCSFPLSMPSSLLLPLFVSSSSSFLAGKQWERTCTSCVTEATSPAWSSHTLTRKKIASTECRGSNIQTCSVLLMLLLCLTSLPSIEFPPKTMALDTCAVLLQHGTCPLTRFDQTA
ncbi:hypothetical protein CaCOL14_007906 [Colletotrichum acutatum]